MNAAEIAHDEWLTESGRGVLLWWVSGIHRNGTRRVRIGRIFDSRAGANGERFPLTGPAEHYNQWQIESRAFALGTAEAHDFTYLRADGTIGYARK